MCGHRARSKSACSQVSAALFYVRTVRLCGHRSVQTIRGFSPASKGSAMLSQSKNWSGGNQVCRICSTAPVVRYTGVIVSTDIGCCSWPFHRSFLNFNFDLSKSGGATALPAPMVVTPLFFQGLINN